MSEHVGERPMYGDEELAKNVTRRLKTIEGHIRGIQKMVNDGSSCVEIMKQIKAVKQALEKVNALALESHLDICVTHGLVTDDKESREKVFKEIRNAFNVIGKL